MTRGITLSLGYDTERPHSSWATGEEGHRLRLRQLALVERLGALLDQLAPPRTLFPLGDYVARSAERVAPARRRAISARSNPPPPLRGVKAVGRVVRRRSMFSLLSRC